MLTAASQAPLAGSDDSHNGRHELLRPIDDELNCDGGHDDAHNAADRVDACWPEELGQSLRPAHAQVRDKKYDACKNDEHERCHDAVGLLVRFGEQCDRCGERTRPGDNGNRQGEYRGVRALQVGVKTMLAPTLKRRMPPAMRNAGNETPSDRSINSPAKPKTSRMTKPAMVARQAIAACRCAASPAVRVSKAAAASTGLTMTSSVMKL